MFPKDTRILVIDDLASARTYIRNVLKDLGYFNAEEAGSGSEALEALQNAHSAHQDFGLLIVDWNMPGMSGFELLEKVRSSKQFKLVPILMVTAESGPSDVMNAIHAGANAYMTKPFDQEAMNKKLASIWKQLQGSKKS